MARSSSLLYDRTMSFQAYLDAVESKTGLTPRELIQLAKARGFDAPGIKAGTILEWLATDYGLGRGHGMSMVHIIQNGPMISEKHVGTDGGTDGVHRDESVELWLDGKATRPV